MGLLIGKRSLEFCSHEIRCGRCNEYLQMRMNKGTSGCRHIIPVDQMVDRFRVVQFMNSSEKPHGQLKCGANVVDCKFGHRDIVPTAHCGDSTHAVIRCNVREKNHIIGYQPSFRNNVFGKARCYFHHVTGAKGAYFFRSGNQLVEIRLS